jgi:predicted permease
MRRWLSRAAGLFTRSRPDRDFADELNGHLDANILDNVRAGMSASAARRDALIRLGGVAQVVDACRAERRLPIVETTMQDLRYALRMLQRSPGFAAAAIVTLALGIGANTAIFSVLNAVILKPLDYQQPDRLMKISSSFPGFDEFWVSIPEFLEFREWTRAFSSVGAYTTGEMNLSAPDRPQRVRMMAVSEDLFTTLRVRAQIGRTFEATDTRPGAPPVVALSDGLWRSAFGGDPRLVGAAADVDGVRRTVVGIMPPAFDVADTRTQIWVPLTLTPTANRGGHFIYLIGRVADGVTVAGARAELESLLAQWRSRAFGVRATDTPNAANGFLHAPGSTGHRLRVDPLHGRIVGTAAAALWVLQGAVVLVLLIACANLSTLLLARAESRRQECAVRSAIGATRGRLLRQAIAEGCLLSIAGATLGLVVALTGVRALVTAFPDSLPRSSDITIDWRVLAFTLAVALATGIIFGIAPLLHLGTESAPALKEGGQRTVSGRHALRAGLVVCEVALAVALVVGAGLLLRTVGNLTQVDVGFDRSHLVTFSISLPTARYTTPVERLTFYRRLLDDVGAAPGVLKVAAMTGLPPLRLVNANSTLIEGVTSTPGNMPTVDYYQQVTSDYLDTMGIAIVDGHGFREDDPDAAPTALVNQTMARAFWPGQSPVGRRVRPCCNPNIPWFTVAGVVRDVKQGGVDRQTGTELYFNASRNTPAAFNVVIRTTLPAEAIGGTIARAVSTLDPSLPVAGLRAMTDVFEESIGRPRLLARLLGLFAALALLLSTIGTYAVLSYTVSERRREIGIRIALGATSQSVMRLVIGQGLRLTLLGVAIGVALALAAGRAISSLLFGVAPTDPITIAAVALLTGIVALLACSLPGVSATRVEPIVALRDQ